MRKLPQDLDEFIANYSEQAECIDGGIRAEVILTDDLRAWMAGHVRVPVEFVDDAMCRTCYTHAAYMTNSCQWCIDREAMLDATTDQS